ncbi:hypothetical protein FNN14_17470 [Cronobacter sakazakii]|nr:hypothetical protein FNN14_17470 [Cronobacter sakazakii]
MMEKQAIYQKLEELVSEAHQFACSLDIGDERTEAFEFYEALRRLQRRGAASQMLAATSPLAPYFEEDWDNDDDWDEDDD